MKRLVLSAAVVLIAALALPTAVSAAGSRTVAGSGLGGQSPFATDAYPGFDGLDDIPRPQRREKSWFLWVKRGNSADQFAYAAGLEAEGDFKNAAKQYDALVREWPASVEAPRAQLRYAQLLAQKLEDYEESFEQYEYMLDFYSRHCNYLELVDYEYKLVNLMIREKKTFLGFSLLSTRVVRQHYESIVRRAPGAAHVPEAMLKIAALREDDQQYEEAVKVYGALAARFSLTPEARIAAYREAKARMWLCRRHAYNLPRCRDTIGYLDMTLRRLPDLPENEAEELRTWRGELEKYIEEDDYRRTVFYDTKQRTPHATLAAYERFMIDHPKSPHAEEIIARANELRSLSSGKQETKESK